MNNKMQIYPENTDSNLTLQKIIDLNIKKCKCIRKIQSENDPSICGCGKSISLHDTDETTVKKKESYLKRLDSIMEPNIGYDEKWSADKCTRRDGYTNAFGEVKFLGYNENTAKYIRIHYETGMDTVLKMLYDKEYWNLKPPRLIISVTGGAKLTLKKQLKISFSKGLVKVATTTNALITSGGSYSGCMKIVGEAFKENALSMDFSSKVNLLGIRNWGSVTNNHLLINTDKKPLSIKEYELVKPKNSVKSELLDPNHSHYLLVDDATNVFGNEVKFRTLLESEMSKKFNNIPIVVLVVGGGPRTVNTVFESLEKETPCVFLESSGESSDIFVFALKKIEDLKRKEFKLCDQNEKFKLPKEFHDEIKTKFKSEYSKKSENEIDKMADCMSQCLNPKYSHLLTVCQSQNSKSEIDVAILNALLRAVKQEKKDEKKEENKTKKSHKKGTTHAVSEDENNKYQKQLHLALDWNRADIARKFIFTDELSDKIGSLNDLMFRAINENRIEFVKLFLEKGFNLKSFLTYRVLFKLYNSISQNSPLFKLLNQYKKGKVNFKLEHQEHLHLTDNKYTFKNIGLVIQYLVNDQFHHKFTKEPFNIINSNECEKILKDTVIQK